MATERIDIVIREQGGAAASAAVKKVGDDANEASPKISALNNVMSQFKTILQATAAVAAINFIGQETEAYINLTNQLRLTTKNLAELRDVESQLFKISQDTTTEFQANVDIYAALRQGAAQYGLTSKEVVDVTNTLALALNAQGRSSQQAQGAISQLARSVAQGEAGGRALVSVFQQLPLVTRAIAISLNVPIARLNEMAQAGEITGQQILKALTKSDLIIQASAQKVDTFADAWGNVRNAFLRYIAQLQGAGESVTLTNRLLLITADLIPVIGAAVITAGTAWVSYRVAVIAASLAQALFNTTAAATAVTVNGLRAGFIATAAAGGILTQVFRAMTAALLANPFATIITALGVLAALLFQFGNAISINGITPLGALRGILNLVIEGFNFLIQTLQPVFNAIVAVGQMVIQFANSILTSQQAMTFLQGALIAVGGVLAVTLLPTLTAVVGAFLLMGETISVITGNQLGAFTSKVLEVASTLKDRLVNEMQNASKTASAESQKFVGSMDDIKRSVDSVRQKFQDTSPVAQQTFQTFRTEAVETAQTFRNAMGDMINASDEWAQRTGANFNRVSQQASQTASTVAQTTSAFNGGSSGSTGSFGSSGGTGTSGGTFSNFVPFFPEFARGQYGDFTAQIVALNNLLVGYGRPAYPIKNLEQIRKALRDNADLLNEVRFWRPDIAKFAGFRSGGEFVVGGSGGPDSQLVQFLATPGERVVVETPSQQRDRTTSRGGDRRAINVNMQVFTPDAVAFRRSETHIATSLLGKLNRAQQVLGG